MVNFIINLYKSKLQFDYPTESNHLLEVLKKHKIPVEYECCSGYCGVCRLILLKGKIDYLIQPLAFIQNNEILPCCCKPIGDIIINI
ncbi:class I ribonucleotide reductase maintenance protein YfaE [Candidatus Fukatsuia anoeciicola]|uniref:class I ribonucleotide reductase maintenance protein YfaE n=1 Tax=Candidatus Fukatsuia anoeciicola TaxID=2994492 RepID=UPI003464933E